MNNQTQSHGQIYKDSFRNPRFFLRKASQYNHGSIIIEVISVVPELIEGDEGELIAQVSENDKRLAVLFDYKTRI